MATEPGLPPFFFAMTTWQAQGDFEECIMSYSSNFLFPLGTLPIYEAPFALRLLYEEWRLPLILFRVRRSCSSLCLPYVSENTSAFRFKTALNDSKSPSPISISNVLSPTKPVCRIPVHMTRGVAEKSTSSTSHHSFRVSLKTVYY